MEEQLTKITDEQTCPMAVMVRDGKILTGHRHYTKDKWKDISVWTLPGGRCDPNESVKQTLIREVAEEVGITQFSILDFIGEVPGAKESDTVPIFFCTTEQDATLMEPDKFSEWRWVAKEDYFNKGEYSGFNPSARRMIVEYLKENLK